MKMLLIALAALPAASLPAMPAAALPLPPAPVAGEMSLVVPVRHHRHRGHWRYRRFWSGMVNPAPPPAMPGGPIIPGTALPPAATATAEATPSTPAGPTIRWVDPDPRAR